MSLSEALFVNCRFLAHKFLSFLFAFYESRADFECIFKPHLTGRDSFSYSYFLYSIFNETAAVSSSSCACCAGDTPGNSIKINMTKRDSKRGNRNRYADIQPTRTSHHHFCGVINSMEIFLCERHAFSC